MIFHLRFSRIYTASMYILLCNLALNTAEKYIWLMPQGCFLVQEVSTSSPSRLGVVYSSFSYSFVLKSIFRLLYFLYCFSTVFKVLANQNLSTSTSIEKKLYQNFFVQNKNHISNRKDI